MEWKMSLLRGKEYISIQGEGWVDEDGKGWMDRWKEGGKGGRDGLHVLKGHSGDLKSYIIDAFVKGLCECLLPWDEPATWPAHSSMGDKR